MRTIRRWLFASTASNGVHPLFYAPGQTAPLSDEWGSLAAWSWGLSRALDYLVTDPQGEFEGGKYGSVVYRLLGHSGLESKQMPDIEQPILNRVGYHVRTGGHGVTDYDWDRFLDFADQEM